METHRPAIRWLRFRLQTMFVFVTLLCLYLGWALNWQRERRVFLERPNVYTHEFPDANTPPWALWFIGERGIWVIIIHESGYEGYNEARRLFPEAFVM